MPRSQMFQFQWSIPADGFQWVSGASLPAMNKSSPPRGKSGISLPKGLFLVERAPTSGPPRRRQYAPLEQETGLFYDFAETIPSKHGILGFANTYGSLSGGLPVRITASGSARIFSGGTVTVGKGGKVGRVAWGDPLQFWTSEILLMRRAVNLWDCIRDNQIVKLQRIIQWDADRSVMAVWEPPKGLPGSAHMETREWIAAPNIHPELLKLFKPGDPVMPGLYYLQRVVNRQLETHPPNPRLLWDRERHLRLFVTPSSLIGALWLQLAAAIEGERKYRKCDHCHKWFERGAQVRADAKFCSSNCRQKAYRSKQAEARELHEKGWPVSRIARHLGSKVNIVKGWIKQ